MIRVETKGSYWDIDEVGRVYRRFNKWEDVRRDDWGEPRPEWSDERAGALQDGTWHPYTRWEIKSWAEVLAEYLAAVGKAQSGLIDYARVNYDQQDLIFYDDAGNWICRAPEARVIAHG